MLFRAERVELAVSRSKGGIWVVFPSRGIHRHKHRSSIPGFQDMPQPIRYLTVWYHCVHEEEEEDSVVDDGLEKSVTTTTTFRFPNTMGTRRFDVAMQLLCLR